MILKSWGRIEGREINDWLKVTPSLLTVVGPSPMV